MGFLCSWPQLPIVFWLDTQFDLQYYNTSIRQFNLHTGSSDDPSSNPCKIKKKELHASRIRNVQDCSVNFSHYTDMMTPISRHFHSCLKHQHYSTLETKLMSRTAAKELEWAAAAYSLYCPTKRKQLLIRLRWPLTTGKKPRDFHFNKGHGYPYIK